jgi:ABC-type amino acid transport substrate-binding protein
MKQDLKRAVQSLVYELYFNRRHNLLMAILDLVQMYESPPLLREGDSQDLVSIINEYMQELIRDGFIINIISLLKVTIQLSSLRIA